jgi:hypothetical protein
MNPNLPFELQEIDELIKESKYYEKNKKIEKKPYSLQTKISNLEFSFLEESNKSEIIMEKLDKIENIVEQLEVVPDETPPPPLVEELEYIEPLVKNVKELESVEYVEPLGKSEWYVDDSTIPETPPPPLEWSDEEWSEEECSDEECFEKESELSGELNVEPEEFCKEEIESCKEEFQRHFKCGCFAFILSLFYKLFSC